MILILIPVDERLLRRRVLGGKIPIVAVTGRPTANCPVRSAGRTVPVKSASSVDPPYLDSIDRRASPQVNLGGERFHTRPGLTLPWYSMWDGERHRQGPVRIGCQGESGIGHGVQKPPCAEPQLLRNSGRMVPYTRACPGLALPCRPSVIMKGSSHTILSLRDVRRRAPTGCVSARGDGSRFKLDFSRYAARQEPQSFSTKAAGDFIVT